MVRMETLNLDTQQQAETLNLDTPWSKAPLDPGTIDNKALRAAYGMQPHMDYSTIKSYLDNGDETGLRVNASARINQKWADEDAQALREGKAPSLKATTPSSVLEDQFGAKFVDTINQAPGEEIEDDNGTYGNIRREFPEMTAAALKVAKEHTALTDKIYNRLQDASAAAEAIKSTSGFLTSYHEDWNMLKAMTGITSLYTERGVVPGTFWKGGFLGGNKEEQRKALLDLPYPQNLEAVDKASDYLIDKDPRAAIDLLSYFYTPSTRTQTLDNAFNLIDVAALLPIGSSLAKGTKSWLEMQRVAKEIAMKHPEAAVGDIEATSLDAVGKTREAGESRATKTVIKNLRGTTDPRQEIEDGISGVFKIRRDEIEKGGPGNTGADVMNRILADNKKGVEELTTLSRNAAKVLRVDPSVTAEIVVKNGYKEMQESHPWLYNEVANVMPVKAEEALASFKYEPHTATWSTDMILHRPNGDLFESVEAAVDYARAKGMPIHSVHGVPIDPDGPKTGVAIHPYSTGKSAPGFTKSIEDLLYEAEISHPQFDKRLRRNLKTPEDLGEIGYREIGGRKVAYSKGSNGVYGQGKGYYIAARIPLNETSNIWADAVIHTPSAETVNKGWINRNIPSVGKIRTADEVLNEQIMINRKVSLYAPALFYRALAKYVKPAYQAKTLIRNFGQRSAFERMLKHTQDMQIDFKSIPELEDYWQRINKGQFPNEAVVRGYFALKFGQDADLAFRNLAVTKNMGRLGAERHTISFVDEQGQTQKSPEFIGMAQKEIPGLGYDEKSQNTIRMTEHGLARIKKTLDEGDPRIAAGNVDVQKYHETLREEYDKNLAALNKYKKEKIGAPTGDGRVLIQEGSGFRSKLIKNMTSKDDLELAEKVKTGEARMIRLYNSDLFPLKDFSGEKRMVQYVISDKAETRPLGYFELPRKEAGHLEYASPFWVKQANVSEDEDIAHYLGDRTAMAVHTNALGKDVVKGLNEIRLNIKTGGKDGFMAAKKAMYENNLPFQWKEVIRKFKSKEWDLNQPFHVVPDGMTTMDIHNPTTEYAARGMRFREASKGASPSKQFAVDFTGERDAYDVMEMRELGTRNNPDLAFKPADTIDAFQSLNRSMQRIIRSTYMDDVKITSVSDWLQRYKHLLDLPNPEDAFKNPWFYFNNTELKKGVRNTLEGMQIEAERYQIKSFVGVPSWWDNLIHSVEQRMADNVYNANTRTGQRAALLAKWSVDKGVRAPDFLRAVAYRAAIGFFAPAQLLVQAATYTAIFGRAGFRKAGQGSIGALLHQYSRLPGVTSDVLQSLDNIAVRLGHFRPGEWLELKTAFEDSGFGYVGHETNTMRAYAYPNRLFKSMWGHVLDAGEIFFNEGERHTRYGAWYTAGAEHRDLNPTGRLTLTDKNWILNRADDHAGNMSQASRSMLQKGVMSFPTQFLGYWIRAMEQFTGSRLNWKQKAGLFAAYSVMYGLPVANSITPLMPFSEAMNKAANEQLGYVPYAVHENVGPQLIQLMEDLVLQGAPAVAIQKFTGKGLNIGTRYGPGPGHGFDFLNEDKSFWSVFTGPLGDMLGQTMRNVQPFWFLGSQFIQGKETNRLTSDDWIQPFKIISSINSSWKFDQALRYQTWYSRNGNPLVDSVSPMFALAMATTGLQPLDVDRMSTFRNIGKDRDTREKDIESHVKIEMTRFFRDLKNNDADNAHEHWKNAEVFLQDYPIEERDTLWSIIASENEQTLPDRIMMNHYIGKHIPAGKELNAAEQYGRELNAKGQ